MKLIYIKSTMKSKIHNKRKGSSSNFLWPFVQQCTEDNQLPEPHILLHAPLAALAITTAIISGFPLLVRKLAITSMNDHRALHLTASGVYNTFHGQ